MDKLYFQVHPNHYLNKSYDSKVRFISYWHQINEIIKLKPKSVLEIGIGNGFVSKYLKERKLDIITLDIDKRLNPDVVGNILFCLFQILIEFIVLMCKFRRLVK